MPDEKEILDADGPARLAKLGYISLTIIDYH